MEKTVKLDDRLWDRILAALEKPWEDARPPLDTVEVDKLARALREQLGTWFEDNPE